MNYGRYQIIKQVGRGSMGVVFQALDPHIDRLVALKVLHTDRVGSEFFLKRFLKEAKVIGRLTHPNIVAIYDVGEEQGAVYIAMEFLEGMSLANVVRDKLPDTRGAVALGVQLSETLDYAHQKGVVHRDIKPSNIIVQTDGQVKITDFGIAHVDDSTATLQTQAGDVMGTPAYMSPEQVLGQPVDGRSDIFSLGIILYELTTGRRPFGGEGKSLVTVFNDIVEVTPPEPAVSVSTIPQGLSLVIMTALQKDPALRFQSGKELAQALRVCLDAPAPVAAPPTQAQVQGRKRAMHCATALGAVIVPAAGVIYFSICHFELPAPGPVAVTRLFPSAGSKPAAVPTSPRIEEIAPRETQKASFASSPALWRGRKPMQDSPERRMPKEPAKRAPKAPPKGAPAARPALALPRPASGVARNAKREISAPAARPLQRFAFLKVASYPPGARVYINGAPKGTTPMTVKLDLGQYQVRLSQPGYQELEREVTLEKMQEYPLAENLKPVD